MTDEELISEMERVRSANNVNWMQIVRIALRVAPEETRPVLRRITEADKQIAGIIKQLGDG